MIQKHRILIYIRYFRGAVRGRAFFCFALLVEEPGGKGEE